MQYITAGESHGPFLTGIVIQIFPLVFLFHEKNINSDLSRRQSGYGRGGRQAY